MSDCHLKKPRQKEYMKIAYDLWDYGAEEAHEMYPEISVEEFQKANDYYDSLRCEGCRCGSCVNLPELGYNLDNSPKDLLPIANLVKSRIK